MPSQPPIRLNLSLFSSDENSPEIDWDIARKRRVYSRYVANCNWFEFVVSQIIVVNPIGTLVL